MMQKLFIRTTKQQQWQEHLNGIKDNLLQNVEKNDRESRFPIENIRTLQKINYPAVTVPSQYHGEGFSVYDMLLTQETLASYDANTALIMSWTLGVAGEIFERKLWSSEKRKELATALQQGALINRAVSEAATGSPTRGGRPQTTATKQGNHWVINGCKTFTTGAPILNYFIVSAYIPAEDTIGNFLIHRDIPGVHIEENWDVMAMRSSGSHNLQLRDVKVEADDLVELLTQRKSQLNGWSLHIPAVYLGIAQAARDYAVQFAQHYQPNSLQTPISELPNVQQHIGHIELLLHQSRFVLYQVATYYDDVEKRPLLTNELAVAKYTVTNHAVQIVDHAMRIVGAKSLQLSNPLQRHYRDVRAGLHNPPMDDMTIQKLATSALFPPF